MSLRIKAKTRTTATVAEVCQWLKDGIFRVESGKVFKGNLELTQRINKRKNSERGDPRVDLCHERKRRSCHVSQLTWMQETGQSIPKGFEIHHRDENPLNNSPENLICCHPLDHTKLHSVQTSGDDYVPF